MFDTVGCKACSKISRELFYLFFLPVVSLQLGRVKSKRTEVKIYITVKTLAHSPALSDTKEPFLVL